MPCKRSSHAIAPERKPPRQQYTSTRCLASASATAGACPSGWQRKSSLTLCRISGSFGLTSDIPRVMASAWLR
eukprot:scaffold1734_cov113-Isochrysis_galbana.AAC.2